MSANTTKRAREDPTEDAPPAKKAKIDGDDVKELQKYRDNVHMAEQFVPILGRLYRDCNVIMEVFGKNVGNKPVIDILKAHGFARKYLNREVTISDTFALLTLLGQMNLGPCRIDLGKLAVQYHDAVLQDQSLTIGAYLRDVLTPHGVLGPIKQPLVEESRDVVLFGFGRIGRLLARILIEKTGGGNKLRLRAIVVRPKSTSGRSDLQVRASLLRRDSTHGQFRGLITLDEERNCIIANGNVIQVIYASSPSEPDYTQYGISRAIVLDNTGAFRTGSELARHLEAKGVEKVVLTAPAGDATVPNVVMGVNDDRVVPDQHIYAAASCTTNAITPTLAKIDEVFGIVHCHVETVHSYTNDQNLLDNFHKKARRGRAAAQNMVITETGAAKAVALSLPALKGKMTGSAVRVPTQNVSLAILILNLSRESSVEEVNSTLQEASMVGPLHRQIDYTSSAEVVSSDLIGKHAAGVIDSKATIVSGNRANVYVWYDNEYGYSCQVVRLVQLLGGIVHKRIP